MDECAATLFFVLALAICLAAVLLNLTGIVLMALFVEKRTVQHEILLHLGALEVLLSCNFILSITNWRFLHHATLSMACSLARDVIYVVFLFQMILLTLDRALSAVMVFRYRVFVTKRRVRLITAVAWAVLPAAMLPSATRPRTYFVHAITAVFLVLSLVTYTYLIRKTWSRVRGFRQDDLRLLHVRHNLRGLKTALLVIISSVVLLVFPTVFYGMFDVYHVIDSPGPWVIPTLKLFWSSSGVCHPLIFIFYNKNLISRLRHGYANSRRQSAPVSHDSSYSRRTSNEPSSNNNERRRRTKAAAGGKGASTVILMDAPTTSSSDNGGEVLV